jgi:hypothetical protein
MTDQSTTTADFQIERIEGFIACTPLNHRAWEWCRSNLASCPEWGQSYLLSKKRGNPLKGHLEHKEGFRVQS